MAWRGVHISQPARLSLRDRQLVVRQDEGEVCLAVEDLAWLVLDTAQVTLTGSLLSALAEGGVVTIVPDAKHHPVGILLPFHQHHAQAYVAHVQVEVGQPLKKRLWQGLVIAKIRNQAAVLAGLGREQSKILVLMSSRVASGDPDNIEAHAARVYWSALFAGFIRSDDSDRRNMLLNYGYAVMRAAIARAVVAVGLLPALGVHHASRSNAFNLVDDLIEPFRPLVDRVTCQRVIDRKGDAMTVEDRRHMAAILNRNVLLGRDRSTVLAATEVVARSLVDAMEHNSAAVLVTPMLDVTD